MPNSVDTRVVEMKFDNANFEKNVRQSIKSLEDLDNALQLEDSTKNFTKIEKAANSLDLSKLENSLASLENRFSTMGIVGATAISELTKSVMNFGKKFYDNTIGQIKSGGMARAMNIANAKFQLEGLGVAWDKIEDDINYGVKDTAYGLDAAAKAASQLTASGVQLGDEMKGALRGISGVAAMTNSSYEDISRIFTTIAGQGRVMADQLNQIAARGLNAAATLAKHFNVTEAEIRDMVSKGKVSFKDFAEAMDDAFGAHAKDANKTFTGALSNMKAALSRIGADFATPYMDNMIRIYNATTKLIDNIRAALKPLSKAAGEMMEQASLFFTGILRGNDILNFTTNIVKGIVNVFGILRKLINPIAIAFKNIFPRGFLGTLADITGKFEQLTGNFQLSRPVVTAVIEIFEALFSVLKLVGYILENVAKALTPVLKLIKPIATFIILLTGKLANLVTQIVAVITRSKSIEVIGRAIKGVIMLIILALGAAISKIAEFVDAVRESEIAADIIDRISDAISGLADFAMPLLAKVGYAIAGAFSKIVEIARSGVVINFFKDFKKKAQDANKTAYAGAGFLTSLTNIFRGGFKKLPTTIYASAKSFEALKEATNGNKPSAIKRLATSFEGLTEALITYVDKVKNSAKQFGMGRALITGFSLSLIALFANVSKLAKTMSKSFAGIPGLITQITRAFEVPIFTAKAKIVIAGVAVSILSLAGSLMLLTMVDTTKLWEAAKALGFLIGVMTTAGILIKIFGKGFETFKNIALSFLGFAGAVGVLALALKQLETIEISWKIATSLGMLVVIMAAMAGVLIAITRLAKPFSIVFGSGFMLAFAFGIKMLVESLKTITELDMTKLASSLGTLLSIMGTLGAIGMAVSFLSPLAGVGFLGIVASFLLLVKGLSMMADVDVSVFYHLEQVFHDIYDAIKGLLWFLAVVKLIGVIVSGVKAISDLMNAIKNPIKGINKGMKELGRAAEIGAIGATFLMMARGLYLLSRIDPGRVQQAQDFAYNIGTAMMTVAAVFTALSLVLPENNIFKMIGNFVGGIAALIAAIAIALKIVDGLGDPFTSMLLVAGIAAVVTGFVALLGKLQMANPMVAMGIKTALAMSVVLGALSLCIGILSMVASTPGGLGAVVASGLMIFMVVVSLAAMALALSEIKSGKSALAAAIGMTTVLLALAACFAVMKDIDAGRILGQGLAIVSIIGVLSLIMWRLSKINTEDLALAAAAMVTIGIIFTAMAGSMWILSQVNFEAMLPNLIAMGVAFGILVAVLTGLAIAGAATGGAFTVALEATAAALASMAFSMDLVALAAVGFSVAAVAFAYALKLIAEALKNLQEVEFENIAKGILVIASAAMGLGQLISLGFTIVLLGALGAVLFFVTPILANAEKPLKSVGKGLKFLGDAIKYVAGLDFSGIVPNMLAIAGMIAELMLLEPEMAVLALTLTSFGHGMKNIDDYTARLKEDLKNLKGEIKPLEEAVEELMDTFEKLPDGIQKAMDALGSQEIIIFIHNLAVDMQEMSEVEMPSVGTKIANDVISGWEDTATDAVARDLVTQFVAGMIEGGNFNSDQLKALGEYLAGLVIAGAKGPNGFDEHSPSKEAILEMAMFVMGFKKGAEVSQQTLDEIGEWIGTEITTETLESLEKGEISWIEFLSKAGMDIQSFMNGLGLELPIDVKLNFNGVDPRTVEGYDTKMAGIPGYTDFYKAKGSGQIKDYHEYLDTTKDKIDDLIDSLNTGSGASGGAAKSTGKASKATKDDTKAKKENTKAVKENTSSVKENSDAQSEWEQKIRDEAEQIEIVTEKFKEYLKTFGKTDPMKNALRLTKSFSKLWSNQNGSYKAISKSLTASFRTINKQVLKFNDSGKYLGKFSKSLYKNTKSIEDRVTKTGKTIMKVMGPTTKVFYKVGDSVEKMTISTTKNLKKLGKQFAAARSFVSTFNDDIQGTGNSEDFILTLRSIEKFFGANKFKNMTDKVKNYLHGIVDEFAEFRNPMDILAKNIDGVGNVLSKNSRATAYVTDGFLALAASLYDGSEAANEYETEHARLLFLLENGLATEEEVAEHFQSYISRITEALTEYRTSVQENLAGSMDIWSKFNQNLLEEGTDLIANIESQIAGYYNWGNMLMELSKRGLDANILKLLTDEGVSSFGKAKALLEMTRSELALFTEDYEMSQAVIQHATDTAIAAMANAQTQASLRAAAAQGNKTAQAQLKQSQKNKKALMDDIKAVAQYRVKYNKLTAKEEKEYLKTLTEEERKYYKKQVKAAKKAQKEQTKLAKNERAKRAEADRLKGIRDSIKAFADYAEVLKKYQNDSKTLTYLLEEETKAFKDLTGVSSNISGNLANANDALLAFADTLDAPGEEGLSYFEEMAARVQRYTDEIKDAVKNTDYLKEAFDFTITSSLKDFYNNAVSNLSGDQEFASSIGKLAEMGYSRDVLDYIVDEFKSDRAQALSDMKQLLEGSAEDIGNMNAAFAAKIAQAAITAEKTTAAVASTTSRDILETEITNATKSYDDYLVKWEKARTDYDEAEKAVADTEKAFNTAEKVLTDIDKRIKQLKKKQKKGTLTKAEANELKELQKQRKKAYADWEKAASEAGKAANDVEIKASALREAEDNLTASQIRLNKAQEEYNKYLEKTKDRYNELVRNAEMKTWFRNQATSVEKLIGLLGTLNKNTDEYIYTMHTLNEAMQPFADVISAFDTMTQSSAFSEFNNKAAALNLPVNTAVEGLLKFGQSMIDIDNIGEDWLTPAIEALQEYNANLADSIASSSDFFTMFKEAEEATDPKEMIARAQSQVDALSKWQEAIGVLAARGLSPELLKQFAEQGLSSYNEVLAWAYDATDEDLGEYNALWEEHQKALKEATDAAMAALAASYSTAGEQMQQAMIDGFKKNGNEKWQEAIEDETNYAIKMVITGIADGVGNAMPEIAKVATDTGEVISSALTDSIDSTVISNGIANSIVSASPTINDTTLTEFDKLSTNVLTATQSAIDEAIEKFKMAVKSINKMIEEDIDHEPVITPVVDTSKFDAAIARMNAAISNVQARAAQAQAAANASQANNAAASTTNTATTNNTTVNVTQNNTSPKALDQVEIYRQTSNLISSVTEKITGGIVIRKIKA